MFDLNFKCSTNQEEANRFANYLDLANTLRVMPISLSDNANEENGEELDEFISSMLLAIKKKAKARGLMKDKAQAK